MSAVRHQADVDIDDPVWLGRVQVAASR